MDIVEEILAQYLLTVVEALYDFQQAQLLDQVSKPFFYLARRLQ